jgi:hypothetical protein
MNERTINLVLTQTECNQLANLLDVGVKAGGIQIAKGALYFIGKMERETKRVIRDTQRRAVFIPWYQ